MGIHTDASQYALIDALCIDDKMHANRMAFAVLACLVQVMVAFRTEAGVITVVEKAPAGFFPAPGVNYEGSACGQPMNTFNSLPDYKTTTREPFGPRVVPEVDWRGVPTGNQTTVYKGYRTTITYPNVLQTQLQGLGPGSSLTFVANINSYEIHYGLSNGSFPPGTFPPEGLNTNWLQKYPSPTRNGVPVPWQVTVPGMDGHYALGNYYEGSGYGARGEHIGGSLTRLPDGSWELKTTSGINRSLDPKYTQGAADRSLNCIGRTRIATRILPYVPNLHVRNTGLAPPTVRGTGAAAHAGLSQVGGIRGLGFGASVGSGNALLQNAGVDPRYSAAGLLTTGGIIAYAKGGGGAAGRFGVTAVAGAGGSIVASAAGANEGASELAGIYSAMGAGALWGGPLGAIGVGAQATAFKVGEGATWAGIGMYHDPLGYLGAWWATGYDPISFYFGD